LQDEIIYLCNNNQVLFADRNCEGLLSLVVDIDDVIAVKHLDMSSNRLQSLDGLQHFVNLREVVLDKNDLTDPMLTSLHHLPQLHTLSLNKNLLCDLASLVSLLAEKTPRLTYLSLLGNRLCGYDLEPVTGSHTRSCSSDDDEERYLRYRIYTLHRLPGLQHLDHLTVTESERMEVRYRGESMRLVPPTDPTSAGVTRIQDCSKISHVTDDVTCDSSNVSYLDLSDHRLRSLEHLHIYCTSLAVLILDRNMLRDHALHSLPRLPGLHTLCLNQNLLCDLVGVLGVLAQSTPRLVYLSLLGNPLCGFTLSQGEPSQGEESQGEESTSVTQMIDRSRQTHQRDVITVDDERHERYRVQVLGILPSLRYLDYREFTCYEIHKANDRAEWSR
jgi:Leucine-rich repeat (LRR) protein